MTDTTHTHTLQRQRRMPRPVDEASALEIRPVTGRSDLRMNRAMEALAGRIIKRYRIYERPVGVGGELGC